MTRRYSWTSHRAQPSVTFQAWPRQASQPLPRYSSRATSWPPIALNARARTSAKPGACAATSASTTNGSAARHRARVRKRTSSLVVVEARTSAPGTPLRQREHVDRVVAARRAQLRHNAEELRDFEVIARHHRNVLLAANRVGDRADGDVAAQDRLPQALARAGVEGSEAAAHVAVKDQAPGGRQDGAVAERA